MSAEWAGTPGCPAADILRPRTLADSHPALLPLLRRGTAVLDVGCGPGGLTAEMARLTDPGPVVGMDVNPEMIRAAEDAHPPSSLSNLVFYVGDVRESEWDSEFGVVNAARALQWIPEVGVAMERMVRAAARGGRVVVLDSDHVGAEWLDPPRAWTRFYEAFLGWRTVLGLDNALAHHLTALGSAAGLVDLRTMPRTTTVRSGEPEFFRAAGFWRMMVDSRGRQMVGAGHLEESERQAALDAFTEWMRRTDALQTTREVCVVGHRP